MAFSSVDGVLATDRLALCVDVLFIRAIWSVLMVASRDLLILMEAVLCDASVCKVESVTGFTVDIVP